MSNQTRGSNKAVVTLVILAITTWSCSSSAESSSVTPSASGAASSSASGSPSASPSSELTPSPTPEPDQASVKFKKKVSTKAWGDPAFKVAATASDGRDVTYAADGGCRVNKTSGRVTIRSVGDCKITAKAVGDPPASASLTFAIEKAQPIIRFGDATTEFARPFGYRLKAGVTPEIDLRFEVLQGHPRGQNDEWCGTKGGVLVLTRNPTADDFPKIPTDCVVRISAASTSKNYKPPTPKVARIRIDYPAFAVNAPETTPVSYQSDEDHIITITVRERSGDAFGIFATNIDGPCNVLSTEPETAPAGTTRYKVRVEFAG